MINDTEIAEPVSWLATGTGELDERELGPDFTDEDRDEDGATFTVAARVTDALKAENLSATTLNSGAKVLRYSVGAMRFIGAAWRQLNILSEILVDLIALGVEEG